MLGLSVTTRDGCTYYGYIKPNGDLVESTDREILILTLLAMGTVKKYSVYMYLENNDIESGDKLGEVLAENPINAISHFMHLFPRRKIAESKEDEISLITDTGNLWTLVAYEEK